MKARYVWLIIAAVFLCMGGILLTVGYVSGARSGIYIDQDGFHLYEERKNVENEQELLPFKKIDMNISVGDIKIIEGESYKISYKYTSIAKEDTINFKVENETLKVDNEGFSFRLINLTLPFHVLNGLENMKITITIPKDKPLEQMKLNTNVGSLTMKDLNIEDIDLKSDIGDLNILNVKGSTLKIKSNVGSISVKNTTFLESTYIKSDIGSVLCEDVTLYNVDMKSNVGSIVLKGDIRKESTIKTDTGSIDLKIKGKETDYNYQVKTDVGSSKIDGEKIKDKTVNNHSEHDIAVKTNMGDIRLDFIG